MKLLVSAMMFAFLVGATSQFVQANNSNKLQSNLNSQQINGNANTIEYSTGKSRIEERQLNELVNAKSIVKIIVKLLFGQPDEVQATSRSVLNILAVALDKVKKLFGQKGRSESARTMKDHAEDLASAGVSMLRGYVKSVLATDDNCVKYHLCESSREAMRDARELGFVMASVGGYASSVLLESQSKNFNVLYDAVKKGRSLKEEQCEKLYSCNENTSN